MVGINIHRGNNYIAIVPIEEMVIYSQGLICIER